MHTTEMNSGVMFHHNGGYFGDVLISAPDADYPEERRTVRVSFEDLASLVGDAVIRQKISELEKQGGLAVLGLKSE